MLCSILAVSIGLGIIPGENPTLPPIPSALPTCGENPKGDLPIASNKKYTDITRRTNRNNFLLPIELDSKYYPIVKEVRLFVSTDEGKTWKCQFTVPPGKPAFQCDNLKDGTYWYLVQTVYKSEKKIPEVTNSSEPELIVVVDSTRKPLSKVERKRILEQELHMLRKRVKQLEQELRGLNDKSQD